MAHLNYSTSSGKQSGGMRLRLLLALACLSVSTTPASAADAGLCLQLFYMKNYNRALIPCRQAADAGDNHAQYALGLMYADGHGVKRDREQASQWYSKAAAQGYAAARYKLQVMQDDPGDSLKQKYMPKPDQQPSETLSSQPATLPAALRDKPSAALPRTPAPIEQIVQAAAPAVPDADAGPAHYSTDELLFRQYMTDAEAGDSHARYLLGLMFHEGVGVGKDDLQAAGMFLLAANQGLTEAQYALGLMYYRGAGVKHDKTMAKLWLDKAARRGEAKAQYCLGLLYADSGDQKDKAASWWRKAAEQGHAKAQHNLAVLYLKGAGNDSDRATALNWFIRAAEHGDPEVQFNLARIYSETKGVERSGGNAANWYFRAGETWLGRGDIEHARASVEKIRQLDKHYHLVVPNAFLADVLDKQIQQAASADNRQPARKSASLQLEYSSL